MADKILVAYFSKTGHTKAAAQKIAKAAGGALHEIVPTKEYPASYVATVMLPRLQLPNGNSLKTKNRRLMIKLRILLRMTKFW